MPPASTLPAQPLTLRKQGMLPILIRAFRFLKPYWTRTAGSYLLLIVITGLTLAIPQFIRWIVDQGIREQNLALLSGSVLLLLGITALKGIFTFLQGRWTEQASQGVAFDLRNSIHAKLAYLSFAYHDRAESGQLLSLAIRDVERVRFLTGRAVLRLAEGVTLLLGTAAVLLWMNPQLALLALITMPVLSWRALSYGRVYRPISRAIQDQLGVLTGRLEQNLRGARVVKAFAQEEPEIERFDRQNDHWFGLTAQAARLEAINVPMLDLIANLSTVIIIWYGGRLVIDGALSWGELVAFTTYMGQLINPVRRLGMIIPALAQAAASGERIFEILDAHTDVIDAPDATDLPTVRGHVRFEHVSFGYREGYVVLDDIDFEAKPGQVIALLGATGSGKSTVMSLIPRFYDPSAGRITVDGYDIRTVTLQSLRSQIGIVLQESMLFIASIRENIAFGRPNASEAEIIAAAKAAQAHDFILEMPKGYATRVGELGVTLSGGQKQRVAIARALLTDPRILILDDATASVDTHTEGLIQQALARLMAGRTSFIIAQRLSTVRMADLILVLEEGRIAAAGTHEELLERSPLYAEIYQRQLRPQEEEVRSKE
ncbi:MAG: ABC transporter ATP-binding protein [Caldilineaceae bacterium]|nr:ABC transporter ATP-binding protein [Caldilineaceae bacterium]